MTNYTYQAVVNLEKAEESHGTANFIIKYAPPYRANRSSIPLDCKRGFFEYSALLHVPTHFNSGTTSIPVQIPEAIHHDDQAHILIITDLGQNSRTLKQCLVEDAKSLDVQQVGKALGEWLAELHIWGRTEAAAPLRRVLSQNNDLTDGPIRYACSRLLPEDDPLWKAVRAHIDDLRDLDKKGDSNFVVHGDFITGNVMVVPKVSQNGVKTTKLAVIDWEAANCRNFTWNDIGQMCAEMYFPTFFGHAGNLGTEMVSAFLKAYISRRELSEEERRMVIIRFGVHIFVWPGVTGWGDKMSVAECQKLGKEYVARAWKYDWDWLKESIVRNLVPIL
ncbi:hypothetical protein D9613_008537 [Agrocybe pediades]|uniref:Aminoglycoside phosphotransferase domain-containing protein n=1 Tax=Agrocybe pediades TaxID=84607 RepID=A0A8H4QSJ9_9AGAR|nr:hypothetical protein D9613_008537 [Agrocybe pediades]